MVFGVDVAYSVDCGSVVNSEVNGSELEFKHELNFVNL